tara:strand:+ start:189 stop:443 length:255 start_codon:yes stop_codon:yes gene_type:complete
VGSSFTNSDYPFNYQKTLALQLKPMKGLREIRDFDALMEYAEAYREEHGFLARWSVIILIIPIVIILVFIWVIAKIIKKVLGRR